MPPRIIDESVVLNANSLTVTFKTASPILVARLVNADDATVATAPALKLGDNQAGTFDLRRLSAGIYSIVLGVGDDSMPFGRLIAERAKLSARATSSTIAKLLRITGSIFSGSPGTFFAWLYADPETFALRLRISAADDIDAFLSAQSRHSAPDPIRFSVITPVYNVAKYLDEYFESIVNQSIGFRSHIELILVDDGSTDRSAKVIKRWQRKFPDNIRYFRKQNGGLSSARNYGLERATHEWLTFTDPDDFLDSSYFAEVEQAVRRTGEEYIAMVSCNTISYYEKTGEKANNHPLRFRYATGERIVGAQNLGSAIQLAASSAFFRKTLICSAGLKFDGRVRPGFEDVHLVGRYLLAARGLWVIFLPKAVYFYRKRSDKTSLLDSTKTHPEWYGDQLRYGSLDLLHQARNQAGAIPTQIQNTIIYDLSWRFRHLVDHPENLSFLDQERRQQFLDLLSEIFALIDVEAIVKYDVHELPLLYRVGILNLFKDADLPRRVVEVQDVDEAMRLVQVVYSSRQHEPDVQFLLGGTELQPIYGKQICHEFLGATFCWEHVAWLPLCDVGRLSASTADRKAVVRLRGENYQDGVTSAQIRSAFKVSIREDADMPENARVLRELARSPAAIETFRDAWVLMDRDTEAVDSAEHLYRFVRSHHPEINLFFVLRSDAPDWPRLKAEGFRLLPFNTPQYAAALLNAKYLISSHADAYVDQRFPKYLFGDMTRHKFVFLDHGVIKDDLSGWLNRHKIDCFITSTPREFAYVSGDGPFRATKKEVVLTGLPRHDALIRSPATDERMIVIMPTWRKSLVGEQRGAGNARHRNATFAQSEYAQRWKRLLNAPRLLAAAAAVGYKLVFIPHKNIEPYVDVFELDRSIEVKRFGGESISPLFQSLSLFLTDFSSVAFDIAYLGKPLIYYQFDEEIVFGGGHIGKPGYFDYERDGFGPVCREEEQVLDLVEAFLSGQSPDPIYRQRADDTFIFRDGRCCERVYDAILALDRPFGH